jgi:hypothetical protein
MTLPFLVGYVLGEHGRQSARLASTAAAAHGAERTDVYDLHERIDRLVLVVAAMWSLLAEQGMTEDQLAARVAEMDQADGVSDGKLTRQPATCLSCEAKVPADRDTCQFCGTPVGGDAPDPFAAV